MRFGVAGYPLAFGESKFRKDRKQIFDWLVELGLDAFEAQMTYGPRSSTATCAELKNRATERGIKVSVHASYFIVFTSKERQKIERSIDTLKRTYELADALGSNTIVLHPGPLYSGPSRDAIERFCDNAETALRSIGRTDIGLFVETAGKLGQLGSVGEIYEISGRLEGVHPCIDFGHVHARTLGTLTSKEEIFVLIDEVNDFLSNHPRKRVHFHYTPIHYGPRGEIQHRSITDRYAEPEQSTLLPREHLYSSADGWFHPRPESVAEALRRLHCACTVISETHNSQEEGARALKRFYDVSRG